MKYENPEKKTPTTKFRKFGNIKASQRSSGDCDLLLYFETSGMRMRVSYDTTAR